MQYVSYKQMCYQAVNTKVIGLLVLISVFISVILHRDFFPATSRSRPQFCLLHGAGKLSCRISAGTVTLSPHASHLQPHQWQGSWAPMGATMLPCPWGWGGQGHHSVPGSSPSLLLGAWPSNSRWFEEANKSHIGRQRARTLREDSPSP